MEKRRREGEISFFVKDSLTRSFLASVELFHVKRGFTNLGQRRPSPPPPPSPFPPSFTRPRLRHDPFSSFLFFSSLLFPPFPFSFPLLSLSFFFSYHCPGISHLTPPPFVPVEIGRHLADGDFRDRFADSPPENLRRNDSFGRATIYRRYVSFSFYPYCIARELAP